MNVVLWVVSWLLAVVFAASGVTKLAMSNARLVTAGLPWVENFSAGRVKAIGVLEVLAAIGLIIPATVNIAPFLVPVAATGAALLMTFALALHVRRHEIQGIVVCSILLALTGVVIIGRFGLMPFAS
jgi:hypothetical protein